MKTFKEYLAAIEEVIANSAGSGNIAGIGVGPQGEPGFTPDQMRKYKKKNQQEFETLLRRKG